MDVLINIVFVALAIWGWLAILGIPALMNEYRESPRDPMASAGYFLISRYWWGFGMLTKISANREGFSLRPIFPFPWIRGAYVPWDDCWIREIEWPTSPRLEIGFLRANKLSFYISGRLKTRVREVTRSDIPPKCFV